MMNSDLLPKLVTLAEAGRALNIGRTALLGAINRGELKAYRIGSRGWIRLNADELGEWVRAFQAPQPERSSV